MVLSDHGEEFRDHGGRSRGWDASYDRGFGHAHTLYQELLHVPLIIQLPPPAARSKVVKARVRLIDLYPTILELVGLPRPEGLSAASLLPLLEEGQAEDRPAPAECLLRGSQKRSLVEGNLKLIEHEASGRYELFDLASDPREQHDLAQARPAEVERLAAALRRLPARTLGPVIRPPAELERELKNLGYVN
jgi:arylsulfatase A-like enzyme